MGKYINVSLEAAFENIALALAITKAPAGEIEGRVREMACALPMRTF